MLTFFHIPAALACGADTDCKLGNRDYRIALPEGYDGTKPVGAIMFAHGYRGSARGVMRNKSLRRMASDMGLALIALDAMEGDWVLPNSPHSGRVDGSVEYRYVDAVLRDAQARFAIDDTRIMAAGFSAGGMLVWYLACTMPDRFAGFAPMSGTFWKGPPKTCAEPAANVVHIHGDADKTVPLGGRRIAQTHQGNVFDVLDMYRKFGRFGALKKSNQGDLSCTNSKNPEGEILDFCLFSGGHSFRTEFVRYAWQTLADAGKL
jgi:polyhydroxybutyrate depolymerase